MSTVPAPAGVNIFGFAWPTEVLEFAERSQVAEYLEPLREGLQQVFPTAVSVHLTLDLDPEIRDDWHITFHVVVPKSDIPDFVEATHAWYDQKGLRVPRPFVCLFRLNLKPVNT
jgi:hypothetical protein